MIVFWDFGFILIICLLSLLTFLLSYLLTYLFSVGAMSYVDYQLVRGGHHGQL